MFASTLPAMEKNFDYFSEKENAFSGPNIEQYTNQPTGGERQFIIENPAKIKPKKARGKRKPKEQQKSIIPDNYMNDFALEPGNTINTGRLNKMNLDYILN